MNHQQEIRRPADAECDAYYRNYIAQVPDGDVFVSMRQQTEATQTLLGGLTREQQDYRYAPGKWSVKEVVGHMLDTEWVFAYRGLRMARGDTTPLPGMEQDDFAAGGNHAQRSMESLLQELRHLRQATLALYESFDDAILDRVGNASGVSFTVRSILFIIAGHERHHVNVLREKYLT